jgi:hypothetical protein
VKLVANIAERDRYYRAWFGLSYLLAEMELKRLDLSPEEIVAQIREQWLDDLSFLPKNHLIRDKQEFTEVILTQNLRNLSRLVWVRK